MSKNATTAQGEAMPEMNRRRLLLGMAAASAGAAVVAVATITDAKAAPIESAELVRLGDMLPAVEAEYLSAYAAETKAIRTGSALWPLAPEPLVMSYRDSNCLERDITGAALTRKGERDARSILSLDAIDLDIEGVRRALRRKRKNPFAPFAAAWHREKATVDEWDAYLVELTGLRSLAVVYDADKERALHRSGYTLARAKSEACRAALINVVAAIMAQPEVTMAGVVIKAQALAAFGKVEQFHRITTIQSWPWAAQFAASVLRIAGEA